MIDAELLSASRRAVAGATGSQALDSLGWWDLLAELSDRDARAAVFALFRAQGIELGNSCALGALMAQPFLHDRGGCRGVVATIARRSPRRGPVTLLVGDPEVGQLLVDRPGTGAALVPKIAVRLRPIDLPGRLALNAVEVDDARLAFTIDEATARSARERSRFLGRVAIAFEILGAAEATLTVAVRHASTRVQFGQPIGKFQAVRHLLAWAQTDCSAVEAAAVQARDLDVAAPTRFDEIVKALAGRNGRRVCERTLQVLGGISFTAEHEHHHFHSRILALDSILGSAAELSQALGAWLRSERTDPRIPSTLLLPRDSSVKTGRP